MKKRNRTKTKILIICVLAVLLCIGTVILLVLRENKKDDQNTIYLDWNEIVNVSFDGIEGASNVILTYNEIPELEERIQAKVDEWYLKRSELVDQKKTDEIKEIMSDISAFRSLENTALCTLPENWTELSNGDVLVLTCGNENLKKLGYNYNGKLEVETKGLLEGTVDDAYIPDSSKETTEIPDSYNGNTEDTVQETHEENSEWRVGNDITINVDNFETLDVTKEEGERIFLYVTTVTDFEKAKEYALKNGNVDYIQYDLQVYSQESDFQEWETWKGISTAK